MDEELEDLTDYAEDGVDLTLIRCWLAMTPAERLEELHQFVNCVEEIREYQESHGER